MQLQVGIRVAVFYDQQPVHSLSLHPGVWSELMGIPSP
jgi:hypothetical protein